LGELLYTLFWFIAVSAAEKWQPLLTQQKCVCLHLHMILPFIWINQSHSISQKIL